MLNLLRRTSFAHLADRVLSAIMILSMADESMLHQTKEVILWLQDICVKKEATFTLY